MGLFKKLQNGDTQLKSLKFGNDRPDGGSSNQPYIKKDIDEDPKNPSFYNDFIIRGGILAPISAAEDTSRLAKYFVDIKNPSGILFTAKQNLLSRTGTKTEASSGAGYGGGALNEGVFTPLSTLGQSLVGFTGTHLNKQGLDPTGLKDNLSITTYQDAIIKNQTNAISVDGTYNNRLVTMLSSISNDISLELYGVKGYNFNSEAGTLLSYGGGAGSVVGFGRTKIKYATDNNKLPIITLHPIKPTLNIGRPSISTWDYSQFQNTTKNLQSETLEDFRESITKTPENKFYLTSTPGYKNNNIENKFNLGNPGSRTRDRSNPTSSRSSIDRINSFPIYQSNANQYTPGGGLDDMIQFSIAILNNEDLKPNKNYMHFRAFIDSFSDSYDADWKSISYMGRAEKLHKYSGFDRKISMGFTVAAQSKGEMDMMYEKLNFLASSLAPEYLDSSGTGYMAGNIAYITLGDYINDQPGIITSVGLDIPQESPWEITSAQESNNITRQLPHMINVSINFTPIHKFRPSKQTWGGLQPLQGVPLLQKPGNKKFIDPNNQGAPAPPSFSTANNVGKLPILKPQPIPINPPNTINILNPPPPPPPSPFSTTPGVTSKLGTSFQLIP
jgi:hypothetical protein